MMDAAAITQLQTAVRTWVAEMYGMAEIVVWDVAYDSEERYRIDFAVQDLGHWRVAEVWLADGEITLSNDLGEGLPLAGDNWPWATRESRPACC